MAKRESKWGYILIGLLLIAVGACFVMFRSSLTVLAISIGVILSVTAIFYGTITIAKKDRSARFAFKIIFSVICLVAGITTAIFNDATVSVMVTVFSLLLIVDGSFKLNTAAMSKRYSVGGWWVMLVASVLIILSAFILAKYPPESINDATLWLGVTIAADGLANIFSAYWTWRYEKAEHKEIYNEIKSDQMKADAVSSECGGKDADAENDEEQKQKKKKSLFRRKTNKK
jgi:uncharacterized membrane protein HdeD (DUF308 family)